MPSHDPVLPPPQSLADQRFEKVALRLADDLAFGTQASLYVGSGLEYAQSRPYAPGDSVKQLDWRLSARRGEPHVKEYDTLKRVNVMLLVDISMSMTVSSVELSKRDLALWIASALGLAFTSALCPVAVRSLGDGVGAVEQREPSLERSRLWRSLADLRAAPKSTASQLAARGAADQLELLFQTLRRRSLVVVLSDFHELGLLDSLSRLAQRHDAAAIRLIDPAEQEPLRAGLIRGREAETGQRFVLPGRARPAAGASFGEQARERSLDALELRTDRPFLAPLERFLVQREERSGGVR